MDPLQQSAKDVFLAALDLPAGQREAYVQGRCGDDGELAARVRKLLVADRDAEAEELFRGGLEVPAELDKHSHESHTVLAAIEALQGEVPRLTLSGDSSDLEGPEQAARSAGSQLSIGPKGNYEILGEIARGGMGVVLRGRDTDLGRDVAVKVLHESLQRKPAVVERFLEEAQIGGQLQHPGIVPVYELGLMADQRPYFTMKLIKGRTLKDLLAAREDVSDDRARFLSIFEDVCQTLAYAHSRRVIHRDLKPGNVMVGKFGEVQVVDWGLAKVIDAGLSANEDELVSQTSRIETLRSRDREASDSRSRVGAIMGTPAYMSPEQARGEVDELDERADVFALGAILAEILTGEPAYGQAQQATLLRAARGELAPALERLENCDADEELVDLAAQCLEASRDRRPRSAAQVAKAIAAYTTAVEERLTDAQISAAYERARATAAKKFQRVVTAAVLLLGAALAGSLLLWKRAIDAAERAQLARQSESLAMLALDGKNRELASANEDLLRSNEDLAKALDRAGEEARKARAVSGFLTDILTAGNPVSGGRFDMSVRSAVDAAVLRLENEGLREQPDVESRVRKAIGEAYGATGAYEEGLAELRRARALALLQGPEDADTLETLAQIGGAQRRLGRLDEAEDTLRSVLRGLSELAIEKPRLESMTYGGLAAIERDRGHNAEALGHGRAALQVARDLGHPELVADMLNDLALALDDLGQRAEATAAQEEALTLNLESRGAEHYITALTQSNLAALYAKAGQYEQAETMYVEALAILRATAGRHPSTASCLDALGRFYRTTGKLGAAREALDESFSIRIEVLGPDDIAVAYALNNLAQLEVDLGLLDDAAAHLAQALPLFVAERGEDHPSIETLNSNLTAVRALQGEAGSSVAHLRQILANVEADSGRDPLTLALLLHNLGSALLHDEVSLDESRELLERALEIRTRELGATSPESARTQAELAMVLLRQGRIDEARSLAEEALDIRREVLGPDHLEVAAGWNTVALIALEEGDAERALGLFGKALEVGSRALPADHWRLAIFRSNHAHVLARLGRHAEAEAEQVAAQRALSRSLGEQHQHTRQAARRLMELQQAREQSGDG